MEKLLDLVVNSIPENATPETIFLFLLSALSIYALFRANVIYDFVERFNKRELSRLRELLADENISEKAKITLRDKIDLIAYKKVTGIEANIYWQKKIIHYYNLAEGRLRYSDFKRAFTFLKININGELEIRKPNKTEIFLQLIWILASISVFTVLSLLLFAFVYATMSIRARIALFMLIIYFGLMLFLFLWLTSLIPTARKIKNELENNRLILQSNHRNIELKQTNLHSKQLRPNEISITNKDIDRIVESYRQQNKQRPIGLAKGEFIVPDNFNDPLPDEILDLFEPK
ncbi:membrane hypothetical protein [Hyella patelloides LEGE 07179]|uniref:Uncharacterized protein n=1 Tax=Hyella patelloides LEGE 07179 TaxID=945734 RepID=A0A563VTA9_9CYAN|nr:hypothetical protein [Hyella patelloides]VEP14680.1 membrane hypothetical protein [Hyella patelloides LEGE 07179]